jgi:hypothetical protein
MVKKKLFIEGTTDDTNGDLATGFTTLFKQKLNEKMPQIIMADGKGTTIDKFKNTVYPIRAGESIDRFLLVDLDGKEEQKQKDIEDNDLVKYHKDTKENDTPKYHNRCFYMIQEMECWFLSQPDVLKERYGNDLLNKIPKRNASEIDNPNEKLNEWLRPLGKGYHKVKDGVRMLKLLNLEKLMTDFPDVKKLVEELAKP